MQLAKPTAVATLLLVSATIAAASEPGQPLDCSDWVFAQPGLSCSPAVFDCGSNWGWCTGNEIAFDNESWVYQVQRIETGIRCPGTNYPLRRTQVLRMKNEVIETFAYVDERCHPNGNADAIEPVGNSSANNAVHRISFDDKSGRLLIPLASYCVEFSTACPWTGTRHWMASVNGLATTFDVLQTFTPAANALGFRVPYMPEGMAAADHFDTYWGALTQPIDFASAQPLACDYPVATPQVGDYLEVADTVPAPSPGQGHWYLTSATYQGQTRFGRKASRGRLSGRDQGVFPACATAN